MTDYATHSISVSFGLLRFFGLTKLTFKLMEKYTANWHIS